ncbi:MAG TPA: RNA 2',3'-cyclic phosphodiesterase [Candidatus Thermoplasmatota archaeon]|nr:RNA 2',3'-cyclic phosphodiesterase [Candidatus Thermoplasmatota archaeon]
MFRTKELNPGLFMRLFVGLPASSPTLGQAARDLEAVGARAVPPRKMHVTLRFLGEVEDPSPVVAALGDALADAPAVHGVLRGAGGFPDLRRARVAWAGVEAAGLGEVAQRVRAATRSFGQPEGRPFVAHLTLARLPRPRDLSAWAGRHAGKVWGPFTPQAVVLFCSVPGRPDHEALARFALPPPS